MIHVFREAAIDHKSPQPDLLSRRRPTISPSVCTALQIRQRDECRLVCSGMSRRGGL